MFISEKFILKYLFTITKVGTSLHALNFEVKIYFFSLQITFVLFSRTNRWVFFFITNVNLLEKYHRTSTSIVSFNKDMKTIHAYISNMFRQNSLIYSLLFLTRLGKASIQPHILSFYIILSQYSHFTLSNPNIKHMT